MFDSKGMTQLYMEKSDKISIKVTTCTTVEDFVDPFPKVSEILFLEEDAVFAEFAIEDKDKLKHNSALIEDTKCSVLVDQGSQAEVSGPVKDLVLV